MGDGRLTLCACPAATDDRISQKLFNELNAHVYYLEYDTERAGTFAVSQNGAFETSP